MTKYRNGLVTISSIRGAAPTTPQGCALTEGNVLGGGAWGEIDEVLGGERLMSSSSCYWWGCTPKKKVIPSFFSYNLFTISWLGCTP